MSKKVFSLYSKILLGFGIAIAGLFYFLLSTYINSTNSITDSRKIEMELRVMRSAERLLDDMQDIETAYRGYAITGKHLYLAPAETAFKRTSSDLWELLYSTASDSTQKSISHSLVSDISNKIIFARTVIKLRDENNATEAFNLISSDKGNYYMQNIRFKIDSLEKIGRVILNESNLKKAQIASNNKIHYLEFAIIIFSILAIIYGLTKRDLFLQNKSANELRLEEEKTRDLYNMAPVGYLSIDTEGNIIQINTTALQWLGLSYEDVIEKKKLFDLVRIDKENASLQNLISETPWSAEGFLKSLTDKDFYVGISGSTKKDKKGNFTECRIVFTDLRERKKAEEQLVYLARLIDNTNDSIISADQNLIIRSWNKGAEKMYGFSSSEVIGKSYQQVLRIDVDENVVTRVMEQVLKNGNWTAEVKHFKKDGTPIYIENSVTVFNKVNEDNFLLVTINQDITERKIVQKKLKILNSDLINQVEQKTNEITDIFSRISDCFVSLDKEGHIIYINQAAEEFIGLPKPQLLGAKLMDLFGTGIETPLSSRLRYAIENESYSEFEEQAFKSKRWVSLKVYPSPNSTSIFFLDISERKKNEFALQENEKKYRLLFENNPIPMWVLDINTRLIIDVNEAAIQNYGYTREEFIGKSAFELRDENERHRFNKIMKPGDSENSSTGHWLHKRKDGSTIVVEIMAYTLFYDNRPCRLILANDVTEKIKAQHEIESSRDQLRQLSGYLEKVREEERTTIAREIHDELGQQLTGLKIDLSWLAKRIDQADRQKTQKVAEMMSLIDETVKTVRKIASELRPGILDDLGLIAALDWQSKEFEKRTGVICRFNHDFSDKSFDKNTATGIFRIYQEALTNVARHAGATEVESFLTLIDQDCIEFTIIDNGKGMGNDLSPKKTLGLIGMKERALMMRGSLHIDSHEGKGTKINLKVPIEN